MSRTAEFGDVGERISEDRKQPSDLREAYFHVVAIGLRALGFWLWALGFWLWELGCLLEPNYSC
jgi:hypothetical protein